jgi:hypothetical protein
VLQADLVVRASCGNEMPEFKRHLARQAKEVMSKSRE